MLYSLRKQGKSLLAPLTIELANQEPTPLYFDIYLVTGDLSIRRLDRGNQNITQSRQSVSIETEQPELLRQVIEEQLDLRIKILLSLEPLQTDFSQTGVNS